MNTLRVHMIWYVKKYACLIALFSASKVFAIEVTVDFVHFKEPGKIQKYDMADSATIGDLKNAIKLRNTFLYRDFEVHPLNGHIDNSVADSIRLSNVREGEKYLYRAVTHLSN